MLFFFEAGFFLLAVATVAIVEFAGRGTALALWLAVTGISLLASPLVGRQLARNPAADAAGTKWRQLLADSWRHLNRLLLIGTVAVAGWWWLGTLQQVGS
jgi:hypothetical protein